MFDRSRCGKAREKYTAKNIQCKGPESIEKDWIIVISIQSESVREDIEKYLDERHVLHCTIYEMIDEYHKKLEQKYDSEKKEIGVYEEKIKKYIECIVPIGKCNLRCSYCYLEENKKNRRNELHFPNTSYIVKALSPDRLGGIVLLNFCGDGETMLWDGLLPLVKGLVEEGHYISIVTNGTISRQIDKMLHMDFDLSHVFIKFSFHYMEFKRLNLLQTFVENVRKVHEAGCSISVEITPSDDLVPYIEEVKKFSKDNFGALPQISVARDETVREFKILTQMKEEDYKKTWGVFDSPMFDFKFDEVGRKRYSNCMAGVWSVQLNIESGDLFKCVRNPWIDNIYRDINASINWCPVQDKCCLPYCFNCHSYLALGTISGVQAPSYYEIRDREMKNGEHWVNEKMKRIFLQKLWINNKEY